MDFLEDIFSSVSSCNIQAPYFIASFIVKINSNGNNLTSQSTVLFILI